MLALSDAAIRDEFPGLAGAIYLNTAAEGLGSRTMAAALARYAAAKARGARGRDELNAVEAACRERAARLLGCTAAEIAFLSNTSDALNAVILALPWQPGDNVVFSDLEFPGAVSACLHLRERLGVELRVVRHQAGVVDAAALTAPIDERTRLVILSHVSFVSGYRADLQAVAAVAHARGARLLVDAAQSLGAMRVDLSGVDFLAACTFKWLLGTHGAAVLYCRAERLAELTPVHIGWKSVQDYFSVVPRLEYRLQPDARRFEGGMSSYPPLYALHDALGLLEAAGHEAIERRILDLSGRLLQGLADLGITALTPRDPARRAGIVAFQTPHFEAIGRTLEAAGIFAWCKEGRVRASAHFYNTEAHVDAFCAQLERALASKV